MQTNLLTTTMHRSHCLSYRLENEIVVTLHVSISFQTIFSLMNRCKNKPQSATNSRRSPQLGLNAVSVRHVLKAPTEQDNHLVTSHAKCPAKPSYSHSSKTQNKKTLTKELDSCNLSNKGRNLTGPKVAQCHSLSSNPPYSFHYLCWYRHCPSTRCVLQRHVHQLVVATRGE